MADYQVIARKWRPQNFSDVVGQQHVIRTLKNAIRQNRLAHAYLFVGPRGVGKTTLARIFAKAMNCLEPQDGEPCGKCSSCRAIMEDSALDIIEIDAASHNTAGDMRSLADEVMIAPVAGRYKIYIIDEVHMLSKQAWNALLKTVEEPPAHIKFIFATTEVHQVLPTIISRCQRFDLLPIPTRQIAERLMLIAETEQVRIEPAAIAAIARAAGGGMRDAQSLLDQMIAFFAQDTAEAITGEQVLSLFGLTDRNDLDAILGAMLANNPGPVVGVVNNLAARGKNLETLFDDLLGALRGIRLTLALRNPESVLEEDADTIAHYRQLAGATPLSAVEIMLELLAPVGRVLHDALNKQIFLETILLKAMREAHAVNLNDILNRLNQLRTAGELKFVDQLPATKAVVPASEAPVYVPEKVTELPPAPSVSPAVTVAATAVAATTPAPLPEVAPEVTATKNSSDGEVTAESVTSQDDEQEEVATSAPEVTAVSVFADICRECVGLASCRTLVNGIPDTFAESVLTVRFGVNTTAGDYENLLSELPSYQAAMQKVTGDWAGDIIFARQTTFEPVETGAAAEPAAELPPEESSCDTASTDSAMPTAESVETVDEAVDESIVEAVVDISPAAMPEAVMPEVDAEAKDVVPGRQSVINDDPFAIEKAAANPLVHDLLDLFGGEVADVHKKRKG